jgi:hypothetical protein
MESCLYIARKRNKVKNKGPMKRSFSLAVKEEYD